MIKRSASLAVRSRGRAPPRLLRLSPSDAAGQTRAVAAPQSFPCAKGRLARVPYRRSSPSSSVHCRGTASLQTAPHPDRRATPAAGRSTLTAIHIARNDAVHEDATVKEPAFHDDESGRRNHSCSATAVIPRVLGNKCRVPRVRCMIAREQDRHHHRQRSQYRPVDPLQTDHDDNKDCEGTRVVSEAPK